MKKKSIVLLSGGLDSVVNLKAALDETDVILLLTFDYGQAAAEREIEAINLISARYGLKKKIIKLEFLAELSNSLKDGSIFDFDETGLDNLSYSSKTAQSVWVPNRNGLFINIASSFAESMKADYIITGFNKEEGVTFPDNSGEFVARINEVLKFSTLYHPSVKSFTIDMVKSEIVEFGLKIRAPFEYIWSCYRGKEMMCGKCESCQRLKRALKEANFYDEFLKINRWGFKE
ncbi:MAG: 7-cyano-7-deazaguanine synthase QueC [Brevinematia bacterium]